MSTFELLMLIYLASLGYVAVLFGWYILVMKAIKKWGKETKKMKLIAILPFAIFDFIGNMIPVTIITFNLPKEMLVTRRLIRYRELINKGYHNLSVLNKLRMTTADKICDEMLDPYDTITGDHC